MVQPRRSFALLYSVPLAFAVALGCGPDDAPPAVGATTDIAFGPDTPTDAEDAGTDLTADTSVVPEDVAPDAVADAVPDTGPPAPSDCPEARPQGFDYSARGLHSVGVREWEDTVVYDEVERGILYQIVYPALSEGEDAPVDNTGGPRPFLIFEHAGGSRYDQYNWFFDVLASRGWIIVSAEHDGTGWHAGTDAWSSHAALASMAGELLIGWSEDPASEWAGTIDTERIALGGHSHGGGAMLRLMQDWRPMNPDGPYDVKAILLLTTRPDLDRAFNQYKPTYSGMAPLLNIGGAFDQDGTTAYGESIGVYEPHGRPGAMIYVEGAEHYSFTDEIGDAAAIIERQAAIDAATQAIVAFFAATVEGDPSALAMFRGDATWTGFDAEIVRSQWHDPDSITIDAFESEPTEDRPSAAIVGIPGQTFVNGFLGDTLEDFDAHTRLIRAELDALTSRDDRVLFFQDGSRGEDAYAVALEGAAAGLGEVVSLTDEAEFAAAIEAGGWDVIVSTRQDGSAAANAPFDEPLADWICDGGRAIVADFRVDSTGAARTFACAGARYDGLTNWSRVESASDLFGGTLTARNPGWGIFTYGLATDETVYATNEGRVPVDHDPTTSDLGLAMTTDEFSRVSEFWAVDRARALMMPTWALELAWEAEGASVEWDLGEIDASRHPVLSIRALAIHADALNPPDVDLDLEITVVDADGDEVSWRLSESDHGGVPPTAAWLERTTAKSVFETWRVPLGRLAGQTPELDLTRLTGVRIVAVSGSGAIVIDDLEFSAGSGCW